MKFAVVVLACVVAAANAQYNSASAFARVGFPQQNQYRAPQLNQYRAPQQTQYRAPQKTQYKPPQKQFNSPQAYKPAPAVVVSKTPVAPAAIAPVAPAIQKYNGNVASSANTLKYGNDINNDGSYSYFFETDNGIAAQAQGSLRNYGGNPPVVSEVAQGSFAWTSPEGVPVAITYIADENGYQPQGAAIPTPPPVPAQIARALDYIARTARN